MALFKRGRSNRLVLDIGTSAVRMCELSPTKAGYQLTKYVQREFMIEPSMEDEEKKARRAEVLEALLKEHKVRTKKTITAVPGQSVFTRNRPLPPVPEHKVTQIVRYEIQQQIPFSLDQIALDYQVLDRTEAGGYEVMMAAIKVDVVEKALELLDQTKRSIDTVDVAPLAAYNWLKHTGEFGEEGDCVALLDLGASTTDIVIQKENQFRFTRSLNMGGNDITAAIAAAFNMSYLEAERLKRERGFAPTGNPQRDGKGGEVIGAILTRLVSEVTRSFAYFRSQPGGGPVTRVIVTGGGACLRNIVPYLQRSLGVEVRIAQPLAGVAVGPQAQEASEFPEQSAVALGLALRCCENVPVQINLIPPRVLEAARRREQAFYWVLTLVTLFLIMASIIPVTAAKDEQVMGRIQNLEKILAAYDPALVANPSMQSTWQDQLNTVQSDFKALESDLSKLDALRSNRIPVLNYLAAINDARPRTGGIALTAIETGVIGGPNNTGDAVRDLTNQDGQATAQPAAQPTAQPAAQSAGPAPGGRFGNINIGALQPGQGAGSGRGAGKYEAAGFQGIQPRNFDGGGRGGGLRGGGPQQRNQGSGIVEPNAILIAGYAANIDVLQNFIANLEQRDEFIEGGVYWHTAFDKDVIESDLVSADPTIRASAGSAGNRPASRGGSDGGLRGLSNLNVTMPRAAAPSQYQQYGGLPLIRFQIDLQFAGRPLPQPGYDDAA